MYYKQNHSGPGFQPKGGGAGNGGALALANVEAIGSRKLLRLTEPRSEDGEA
jgi:hypothetical protein